MLLILRTKTKCLSTTATHNKAYWQSTNEQSAILGQQFLNNQSVSTFGRIKRTSQVQTMNDFGSERSKPWNIYTSNPTPSQTGEAIDREASWKTFGTSMNAIAFGFVATAILISMFLIMAIFEHLFRPNPSFSSPQEVTANTPSGSGSVDKLGNPQTVPTSYALDFSVVMPGQKYPTFIAQPAPLPCPREGIYWPNHEHNNLVFP